MMSWFTKILASFLFPSAAGIANPVISPAPQNYPPSPDVDTLARTIWGEARGEGYNGMQAVANVIINRYKYVKKYPWYGVRWGVTVRGICQHPYQFSVWNKKDPNLPLMKAVTVSNPLFQTALDIAQRAVAGQLEDITQGSTYYHTKAILPDWAKNASPKVVIGSHKFYTTDQVA